MNIENLKTQLGQSGIAFTQDDSMRNYTTFRIGGNCPLIVHCRMAAEIEEAVRIMADNAQPFLMLGEGSNVLVSDQGVPIPVMRFFTDRPEISIVGCDLVVSGASRLDDVAAFSAQNGLAGMSYANGIPGTLAGAIAGNAGAFGRQISDIVRSIDILLVSGERRTLSRDQVQFGYRHSCLKNEDAVIMSAVLSLQSGSPLELIKEREEILAKRREKHPDYKKTFCAGSFFKNIVHPDGTRQAAGWFLDQAGCKTLSVGDAAVFDKHANIVINRGQASAGDVLQLAQQMKQRVFDQFGITLAPEVRIIGNFAL